LKWLNEQLIFLNVQRYDKAKKTNQNANPLACLAYWWYDLVIHPVQSFIEKYADLVNDFKKKRKRIVFKPSKGYFSMKHENETLLLKPSDFFQSRNFYFSNLKGWFCSKWGASFEKKTQNDSFPLIGTELLLASFNLSHLTVEEFHFWPYIKQKSK